MYENNNKYISSLIDSSKRGSKNAFLQLCDLNLRDLYSFCLMLTADTELAEKFTKKVLIHAWNSIKQIRVDASFKSWLHGFAIYFILDEIRKLESANPGTDISQSRWGKARQTKMGNYLISLTTWERIAVILRDLEKYSYNEVRDLLWQFNGEQIRNLVISARKKYLAGVHGLQ